MLPHVLAADGDLPEGIAEKLRLSGLIACDIETSGLDWRAEKIGTCQLYSPSMGTVVVIVNASQSPERMISLLEDPGVTKVFHHAPFDLRFLRAHWNVHAGSVVCTKIASRLLQPHMPRDGHSLKSLLYRYMGITLDKTEQTSDWLRPHLSDAQLNYAVADVRHLLDLWEILKLKMTEVGLLEIYDNCMQFLPTQTTLEINDISDIFSY